ncbi:MAG: hypothetical protein PHF00_09555 [Elusimicrobia bacterium]|nr:hypothetical protein [Elusimicrobiota bacterium]
MTLRAGPMILAAASLIAAAGGVCRAAEIPVGVEAKGLDSRAALGSPSGLDLRDELGRPVSKDLIEKQLKAAQAACAAETAYSSRLPRARSIARSIELWEGLKESLGRQHRSPSPVGEYAAVVSRSVSRLGAPAGLALGTVPAAYADLSCRQLILPRAAFGAPMVLRC